MEEFRLPFPSCSIMARSYIEFPAHIQIKLLHYLNIPFQPCEIIQHQISRNVRWMTKKPDVKNQILEVSA
jgi:hypothetical protein